MNTASTFPAPCLVDVVASSFGPHSYPIETGTVLENGDKICTLPTPAPVFDTYWAFTCLADSTTPCGFDQCRVFSARAGCVLESY